MKTWPELKQSIYYYDGSLRDIYVLNTTAHDWKNWINFVNENCIVDWLNGKTLKSESKITFDIVNEFFEGNEDYSSSANILIDKIQLNVHFFQANEIEFDLDPKDFHTIDHHNKFLEVMKLMSIAIQKPIIITPENEREKVLLTILNGEVL